MTTEGARPNLENRFIILPTNLDTRVLEGLPRRDPLAYVEAELDLIIPGKDILIIDYAGRNNKADVAHFPGSDVEFRNAREKAENAFSRFKPNKYIILSEQDNPYSTIKELDKTRARIYHTGGNSSGAAGNTQGYENWDGTPIGIVKGSNKMKLSSLIRAQVDDGLPYIGTSAGQMNAMGLVDPHHDAHAAIHIQIDEDGELKFSMPLGGMNLVHNQLLATQPHYDGARPTHYGDENQHTVLREIINNNPWITIIGMVDNSALKIEGTKMTLIGDQGRPYLPATAFILSWNSESGLVNTTQIWYGDDLSYLLDTDLREDPAARIQHARLPRTGNVFHQ